MERIEGKTSAELRQRFLELQFVPIATAILARDATVQAVGYTVGQYFCDEAEDAVHGCYVVHDGPAVTWPPSVDWSEEDQRARLDALFPEHKGFLRFEWSHPQLDENGDAITAFASHCPEGCDQEMPITESHVLYALARRDGAGGVRVEVVGKLLRPDWEDRFDVGFDENGEQRGVSVSPPKHALPPAPPAPRGLWTRLRRWFGGGGRAGS